VRNDRSRYGNHCINASRSDDRATEILHFSGELSRKTEAAAAANRKITVSTTSRVNARARAPFVVLIPALATSHGRGADFCLGSSDVPLGGP